MRKLGEYLGLLDDDGQWVKADYRVVAFFFVATVAIWGSPLPFWGKVLLSALTPLSWSLGEAVLTRRRRP